MSHQPSERSGASFTGFPADWRSYAEAIRQYPTVAPISLIDDSTFPGHTVSSVEASTASQKPYIKYDTSTVSKFTTALDTRSEEEGGPVMKKSDVVASTFRRSDCQNMAAQLEPGGDCHRKKCAVEWVWEGQKSVYRLTQDTADTVPIRHRLHYTQ